MRPCGAPASPTRVWCWQERFRQDGFDALLHDETRPSRVQRSHKHPKGRQWLERHKRFTFRFTPTSYSWLNAVEGFFAELTKRRLKRGVFRSITDLQAAVSAGTKCWIGSKS